MIYGGGKKICLQKKKQKINNNSLIQLLSLSSPAGDIAGYALSNTELPLEKKKKKTVKRQKPQVFFGFIGIFGGEEGRGLNLKNPSIKQSSTTSSLSAAAAATTTTLGRVDLQLK